MNTTSDIYWCDPAKNYLCAKTGCFIFNGPCHKTTHEEFKKDGTEAIKEYDETVETFNYYNSGRPTTS